MFWSAVEQPSFGIWFAGRHSFQDAALASAYWSAAAQLNTHEQS